MIWETATEEMTDIVAYTILAALCDVSPAASGSAVPAVILPPPTSSITWSARDTRKYNFIRAALSETRYSNATTVGLRTSSFSVSSQPNPIL